MKRNTKIEPHLSIELKRQHITAWGSSNVKKSQFICLLVDFRPNKNQNIFYTVLEIRKNVQFCLPRRARQSAGKTNNHIIRYISSLLPIIVEKATSNAIHASQLLKVFNKACRFKIPFVNTFQQSCLQHLHKSMK